MKPETLEKIRRLFADKRGDPAMREIARRIVRENEPAPKRDPRHPGLIPSPEYIRYMFFDLDSWMRIKRTGTLVKNIFHEGRFYQIRLKKHKEIYSWILIDMDTNSQTVSEQKYVTLSEAQEAAWKVIETMHSTPPSTKP